MYQLKPNKYQRSPTKLPREYVDQHRKLYSLAFILSEIRLQTIYYRNKNGHSVKSWPRMFFLDCSVPISLLSANNCTIHTFPITLVIELLRVDNIFCLNDVCKGHLHRPTRKKIYVIWQKKRDKK